MLPENSLIQSATFITAVRVSSSTSFTFREAVRASSVDVSRSRRPVAARRSSAAAGRSRKNSSRSPRSTTRASRSSVTCAVALRGPPSRSEISPKKSPARAVSRTIRSPTSFLNHISTTPVRTMNIESPGSPGRKSV